MRTVLLVLTTCALVSVGGGLALPSVTFAADTDSHTTDSHTTDSHTTDSHTTDSHTRDADLEAQLEDARTRLEQAAHEVAELTSRMSGEQIDKFKVYNYEREPRAIIGVQLDPSSGREGARIQEISPGGPADEAGLHVGDVITSIDDTEVKSNNSALLAMRAMKKVAPDSKVDVRVMRDGKSRDFVITARRGQTSLGRNQSYLAPMPPLLPGGPVAGERFFGPVIIRGPLAEMELATLTPQLGHYFGTEKGVLVVRAPKDFKLEDGDVILAIDGREPSSGSHATRILASYQPGEKISLKIMRQQKAMNLETTLPEEQPVLLRPREDGTAHDHKTRMTPHTT